MQENKGRQNPFLLAPSLVLLILLIFGILSFITIGGGEGYGGYIVAALSVLLVFGSVIAMAIFLRGSGWLMRCFGNGKKGSFLLCLSASGMMMIQSVGIRSFLTENFYDYRLYSLYGMTFESKANSTKELLLMIVTFVLLPVLMEEIFFRGFLMSEYRYGGVILSVTVSSFLYALTGMSLADFPVLFLNGILLSAVVFLTGNLFYSFFAHLLYAMFALSFEKYIFFIAEETRTLIFLVLVALGLLCAVGFCGSAEKILREKGENEERTPIRLKKGKLFMILRDVFYVPTIWADVFIFIFVCVLHIFLDV